MAYTSVDKSKDNMNTVLYTGNASARSITGVGFQPDFLWTKRRDTSGWHYLQNAVRGAANTIYSNATNIETSSGTGGVTSFDSDGFSIGTYLDINANSGTYVGWNWKAGGTAPAITYTVKVVSDSGNKYRFDDFGTSAVTLDLQEGGTYTFDQSDSSNAGHPLRFYTAADKTGGEYTTGVTTNGTPGSSGAYTRITVAASAPTLYYQCSNHAGMGGQANTNSLFGSSNFGGSIQSTVSANTSAGFSIIKYTGSGSLATIGHGLGVAPKLIILKRLTGGTEAFPVDDRHQGGILYLNETGALGSYGDSSPFPSTSPTTSAFSIGTANNANASGSDFIAYCFAQKDGFSQMGSYIGLTDSGTEASMDDSFIYTGFAPHWLMVKKTNSSGTGWFIFDRERDPYNYASKFLMPQAANGEDTSTSRSLDFLSNGFKFRGSSDDVCGAGSTYFYMAFGQSMVGSNNIPNLAR